MARAYRHHTNWGGPRPGAGRPLEGAPTRKVSITLPEDLLGQLDQEACLPAGRPTANSGPDRRSSPTIWGDELPLMQRDGIDPVFVPGG